MKFISHFTPISIYMLFQIFGHMTHWGLRELKTIISQYFNIPSESTYIFFDSDIYIADILSLVILAYLFYKQFFPLKKIHSQKWKAILITFSYLSASLAIGFFHWIAIRLIYICHTGIDCI